MKHTVKGTTGVWITSDHYGPDEIKRDGAKAIQRLGYSSPDSGMAQHGWTLIGTAHITLDLLSDEKMVESKVASMQAEIIKIRATSENAITRLQEKIQSLLAITNEAGKQ